MISSEMIEATPSKGGRGRGVPDQLTKDLKDIRKLLLQPTGPTKGRKRRRAKRESDCKTCQGNRCCGAVDVDSQDGE